MKIDWAKLPQYPIEFDLETLFDANVHYGHPASQWHPKMQPWIHCEKNGVHIFDLEKTAKQLQIACSFFYDLGLNGKQIVMVGTKRQAREIVVKVAKESGMRYIVARWLGGFLTNWEQVFKSLKNMISTQEKLEKGDFSNRTKYELVKIEKELNRSRRFFDGVRELTGKPDALFIVDPKKEKNAMIEANLEGITVVALVDSNTNPQSVDLVIPGNDDALKSITYIVTKLGEAYAAGKKKFGKTVKKTEIKEEKK